MEPFFDIDKLHKRQSRQRRKRLVIGTITLSLIAGFGVITSADHSIGHKTTLLTGNDTASTAPISSTAKNSILNEAPVSPNSVSASNNSLKRQIAQEQALAAQEEAIAKQNVANAQNEQANLNNQTPPAATQTNNSVNVQYPNPSLCPQIKANEQTALAPYSAQTKPLLAAIQGAEQLINENPTSSTASLDAQELQADNTKLEAIIQQEQPIENQYASQLGANECP